MALSGWRYRLPGELRLPPGGLNSARRMRSHLLVAGSCYLTPLVPFGAAVSQSDDQTQNGYPYSDPLAGPGVRNWMNPAKTGCQPVRPFKAFSVASLPSGNALMVIQSPRDSSQAATGSAASADGVETWL
jgi:hypothetical protein